MSFTNPLLTEDILPEVFKFLSVRDRKNARLVCKLWLDVCNYEKFTKTEAFFICNVYDYQTILDVLQKCRRKSLNLKFDQSRIDADSLLLWKTCGKRIESLNFFECTFLLRVMPQIFKLCVNLVEFTLSNGEFVGKKKFHRHPFAVVSVLLPKKKIIREKLTTLNLESFTLELKSQDIQCLASTFPSLRTLKMNILLNDDTRTTDGSSQSSNFAMILDLFETNLKGVETVHVHFPTKHQIGIIDIHLAFIRQHEESCSKPVPLSLVPFFKVQKNLTETPFLKYCVSISIDGTFRTPYVTPDLTVLTRLIEENPLMEKLDLHYLLLQDVTKFCSFFTALVKSQLKHITLGVTTWPAIFNSSELDKILETEDLPINHSIRCLKIYSTTESLSSLCLKYFGNIEHLSVKPGDPNLIFKTQSNLKHLSIEWDEEECSTSTESIIESLEVIEVRGTGLNFLSSYRFPNLKYLYFFYEDHSPDSDYSDDSTDPLEGMAPTSDESCSAESVDLDELYNDYPEANDDNGTYSDPDEDSEYDDFSVTSSVSALSVVIRALNRMMNFDDSDLSDENSEGNPDDNKTLLGFLALDLGERCDSQWSTLQDPTEQNIDANTKLYISRIEKIISFIRENAPNLEGFRFTRYSDFTFPADVYTAFFKACSNIPKLRYLSLRHANNHLSATQVKTIMLKYMTPCPSLRTAWFESGKCKIALYFNTVSNKLEFADEFFCSDGMIDLRNFHLNGR